MTKIYTDPNFDIKDFISYVTANGLQKYFYEIYHASFFLCLIPRNIKEEILSKFNRENKTAFDSILNVHQEFCQSIEECDYVLLPPTPLGITRTKCLLEWKPLIQEAKKYGKKVIMMLGDDSESPFPISKDLGIVFRCSGFSSESEDNIRGLPTTNSDIFRGKYLPKQLSIGFCGKITHPKRKLLVETFMEQFPEECDISIRLQPRGNNIPENRKGYFKNLHNNLYGLCARGGGNFSFRLGELLMMGRIPILLDTDCLLPFRESIPYETNCIFITENDLPRVREIVTDFHERHSEEDLIRIQKENRSLWEEYFTPEGIFNHIIQML
jgi:hypothetical protein